MPEVDEEVIEFSDNTEFESDETGDTVSEESNEEIEALQAEITELQDKYLRLVAEFDNYRKRTIREKAELIQTAGESLLKDILPLVDDFERGLDAAAQAEDMDAVRSGMDIIYNKLIEFLSNHGVKEIEAMNELFNTDWHDAVTNIPAPSDDMKGKIVDVIQKGYTLNDKIIRYPKVVVGE
jgi:molecular chaperone GrpE